MPVLFFLKLTMLRIFPVITIFILYADNHKTGLAGGGDLKSIWSMIARYRWLIKLYFNFKYMMKKDPYRINESSYEQTKIAKSIEKIKGQKFPSALEIGCGAGHHTGFLLPFSGKILCIDSSSTALKRARERICDERVTFKQLDIVSDDLKEKFDLIFCSEVLYYLDLEQLHPTALKIINWLRTEGTLILVHARLKDSYFERIVSNRPDIGVIHSLFIKSNNLYNIYDEIETFYRITVLKKFSE